MRVSIGTIVLTRSIEWIDGHDGRVTTRTIESPDVFSVTTVHFPWSLTALLAQLARYRPLHSDVGLPTRATHEIAMAISGGPLREHGALPLGTDGNPRPDYGQLYTITYSYNIQLLCYHYPNPMICSYYYHQQWWTPARKYSPKRFRVQTNHRLCRFRFLRRRNPLSCNSNGQRRRGLGRKKAVKRI